MFSEYKYKTELHAHTKPGSHCSDIPPEELVKIYKNAGYTSLALTNHFTIESKASKDESINRLLDDFRTTKKLGEAVGLNIILGAELRFTECVNDYLIYGIDESEMPNIYDLLDKGIDNFYKAYKNDKNVIIQAHPFRNDMTRANTSSIDGVEVFNMHPGHNGRIACAAKHARDNNLIISAGTDFHHYIQLDSLCSIMTKEPILDSVQLADILKTQDFIIDIFGYKILPR